MRFARVQSSFNMQSWSDYALNLVNSTATITSLVGVALVLISVGFAYFTGNELAKRSGDNGRPPEQRQAERSRLSQVQTELAATRKSEKYISSRLSKTEAELAKVRRSEETKGLRLSKTEADLSAAQKADKEKTSKLSASEVELSKLRSSEGAKTSRLSQLEADLSALQKADKEKTSKL